MVKSIVPNLDATVCLNRLCEGDSQAAADLFPLVYDELRALASAIFRRERVDHTLQPTAVVNELFLKLVDQSQVRWNGRAHFVAVAAVAIRNILIDHARRRNALKRRAQERVDVDSSVEAGVLREDDVISIHEALQRLAGLNQRQARIVELRFFGGQSIEEIAEVLGVSPRTVKGEWRMARAWLQCTLDEDRERRD